MHQNSLHSRSLPLDNLLIPQQTSLAWQGSAAKSAWLVAIFMSLTTQQLQMEDTANCSLQSYYQFSSINQPAAGNEEPFSAFANSVMPTIQHIMAFPMSVLFWERKKGTSLLMVSPWDATTHCLQVASRSQDSVCSCVHENMLWCIQ